MAFATRLTPWHIARLTTLPLSVASLILATIVSLRSVYSDSPAEQEEGFLCELPIAGNGWTILHNVAVPALAVWKAKTWHPGFDVALDFVGWGLNWSMAILAMIDPVAREYDSLSNDWFGSRMASVLCTFVVGTVYLACFIQACRDTDRLRKAGRDEQTKFQRFDDGDAA